MKQRKYEETRILLVEDNPVDIELTLECFKESKIIATVDVVNNGIEALDFLEKVKPDIILLDLNMPKMDGRELLAKLKTNENYKHIPVVVLTTSQAHEDIIKSYNLQASAYLAKPVDYIEFLEMMKQFDQFYLTFVKLPKGA